ncbi:glutamine--tRNA ligase/YqeY domain fusion protein [Longimicrobium sp.]|uniref:glutamine--tRNA ligase/YqeY domain fusion protein n=1 Tax=Longimicrobium sp. TaxID=2029185 RepID=UPI002E342A61|nr:glutamine--tRNA ligase/YqeY domain fusion protein [Longimicrobium sp.]HEX6039585.1 glutamine--tRNA ligase/YqeY domain fusion protein [Longimicrobium sp.]
MTDTETKGGSEPRPDAYADREALDFIRAIVAEDLRAGKYETIVTRFPPEPNGYLHIGHAKSILLNYGIARETGGRFHLRFDDTNPETEDVHYVESIADTVRWLGADFGDGPLYAADYFEQMYRFAEFLVQNGLAYVDSSSDEEIREARGTVTEAGRPTAYRDRSAEENLDLFRRMRAGEFPDGAHVLRAKIDLASRNMLLRDPLLYRIRHAHHYRTGDRWCIYPLYDYAHPIEDAIEGITHSLCTLEFDNNRAVYDWVVDHWQDFVRSEGGTPARPHQYEFARGELEYTITSKRKSLELVKGGYVNGWDDPRMATIAAFRRRGVTPEALKAFWDRMGVAKFNSRIDIAKLEHAIRDDLNTRAPRVLCVLKPLKVTLTNYPAGETETFDAPLWPHDVPNEGSRPLPFSGTVYIDRDDFQENPPKGFHRLSPGNEVRLRYAYVIRCDEVVKDAAGEIVELRCSYDPRTRGGSTPDGRQVKGTIQWVSAAHAVPCEVRLYDRLFTVPDPDAREGDFKDYLNPESLVVVPGALIEPSVKDDPAGSRYQFERVGYFCSDIVDSRPDALVFNRTVTLRDAWAKASEKAAAPTPKAGKKPKAERAPKERSASAGGARPSGVMEVVRSPELEAKRERFVSELGLATGDADVLTRDDELAGIFEATVALGAAPKSVASWMVNVVLLEVKERGISNIAFTPAELRALIGLVDDGTISSAAGKTVLAEMVRGGGSPAEIVERRGLRQVSDPGALTPIVDQVIAANAAKADEYRAGKTGLLGFFVGQVMRQSGGNANPALVSQLVQERLES